MGETKDQHRVSSLHNSLLICHFAIVTICTPPVHLAFLGVLGCVARAVDDFIDGAKLAGDKQQEAFEGGIRGPEHCDLGSQNGFENVGWQSILTADALLVGGVAGVLAGANALGQDGRGVL